MIIDRDCCPFSDQLYSELSHAPNASGLLSLTMEARESLQEEYRVPDPLLRPSMAELMMLGIKPKDAEHVADAVALGCTHLLTNDRRLRNKSKQTWARWGLRCRRPSEFVVEGVCHSHASWPVRVPWPCQLWPTVVVAVPTPT